MECRIRKGELLCLDGGQTGLKLICASGRVWVTTGDGVDYLITGNGCFMVKRGEKALAEALEQCELSLSEPTSRTTRISHRSGVMPGCEALKPFRYNTTRLSRWTITSA